MRSHKLTLLSCLGNGDKRYVVKGTPQDFAIRTSIYRRIGDIPHIRTPTDIVPERRMFVFEYLDDTLLRLITRNLLPSKSLRYILKCALQGLALLPERDIVHNGKVSLPTALQCTHTKLTNEPDIKPDNILVRTTEPEPALKIEQVHLADLEDAAHVPPGSALRGAQLGNWMWRSPE